MAFNVTSASGDNFALRNGRGQIVRNSSGIPYLVLNCDPDTDSVFEEIQVWKGNAASPTSFSEVDGSGGNKPSGTDIRGVSAAIDSNDYIHISWLDDQGKSSPLKYIRFRADGTNDDWFEAEATVVSDIGEDPTATSLNTAIAVDSNDVPHIVYNEYPKIGGTATYVGMYVNKTSGTWQTPIQLYYNQGNDVQAVDICIDYDNYPYIAFVPLAGTKYAYTAIGNANNATSFTSQNVDTMYSAANADISVSVDGSGAHWIGYVWFDTVFHPATAVHKINTAWSSWTIRSTGTNYSAAYPSSAITTPGRVVLFYEDSAGDINYDFYNYSSWDGETELQDGNYSDVITETVASSIASSKNYPDDADADDYSYTIGNPAAYLATYQTFLGDGNYLTGCSFFCSRNGTGLTGNVTGELYAHTGTYGSGGKPTGSPLATSINAVAASSINASPNYEFISFYFDGTYQLASGTPYCIVIRYEDGSGTQYIIVRADSSGGHAGNSEQQIYTGGWYSGNARDLLFQVSTIPQSLEAIPYIFLDSTNDILYDELSFGGGDLSVNVTDAVTVGDTVSSTLPDALKVNVSDAADAEDNVTVEFEALPPLEVDVTDNVDAEDSVSVSMEDLAIVVSDDAPVDDSVTVSLPDALEVDISDSVGVSDSTDQYTEVSVVVVDNADVSDTVAAVLPDALEVDITDLANVSDTVTPALNDLEVDVTDTSDVEDNVNVTIPLVSDLEVDVTDNVDVEDNVSAALDDLEVDITDTVDVADTVVVQHENLTVDITDVVDVSDTVTVAHEDLVVDVSDAIDAEDSSVTELEDLAVNVSDNVDVEDSATAALPDPLEVDVTDNVDASDNVNVTVLVPGEIVINVTDSVSVGDTVTATLPDALEVDVTDAVDAEDTVTVSVTAPGAYIIDVTDAVSVGDSVSVQEEDLSVEVSDGISVDDSVAFSLDCNAYVTDSVSVGDSSIATLDDLVLEVTDLISVTDIIETAGILYVVTTDSVNVSDQVSVATDSLRISVSDAISIGDFLFASPLSLAIVVGDSVVIVDTINMGGDLDFEIAVTEAVTVTDSVLVAFFVETPAERIYDIAADTRVYDITSEGRTYDIDPEDRTFSI